jgi:hypothetical protein
MPGRDAYLDGLLGELSSLGKGRSHTVRLRGTERSPQHSEVVPIWNEIGPLSERTITRTTRWSRTIFWSQSAASEKEIITLPTPLSEANKIATHNGHAADMFVALVDKARLLSQSRQLF